MLRRPSVARHLLALAALALAACAQERDSSATEEAPAEAPSSSVSADPGATAESETTFCAEVGRRVSPQDCADFAALAEDAAAGEAAFNTPDPMRRGDVHTLQLAISYALTQEQIAAREEAARAEAERARLEEERLAAEQAARTLDQTHTTPSTSTGAPAREAPAQPAPPPAPLTPAETVDPLQGDTVQFTPLVGRFMRAELVGNGFEITPLTEASQEVLRDSVTTWSWRVVANEGGRRSLTLRTVVEGCTAEGQCYPLRSTSQNYDVTVEVGVVGQVQDFLTAAPTWLRLVAGVLTALAVLIGAWFGLRNAFRKGRAGA